VVLLSIVTGVVSALTTTVPGGQLANIIDKPITALIFLGLFLLVKNKVNGNISAPVLTVIGTAISGSIFLLTALYIVGLMEVGFIAMFLTIGVPAAAVNTSVMVVIYPVVQGILTREPIPASLTVSPVNDYLSKSVIRS